MLLFFSKNRYPISGGLHRLVTVSYIHSSESNVCSLRTMVCCFEKYFAMQNPAKLKESLLVQALVFILTVISLLVSVASHMRSDLTADEMHVMRERVRRLEARVRNVVSNPTSIPCSCEDEQGDESPDDEGQERGKRNRNTASPLKPRKGINRKIKIEIRDEIRTMMGSLANLFCTKEEKLCLNGAKGAKGEAGTAGTPGIKGQMGVPGKPGPRGVKGDPGISVSIPIITAPSRVETVLESRTTSLSCQAEGLPVPKVTWRRMDRVLPAGRHVMHGNGTLVINEIRRDDEGMYVCQATNMLGTAESITLLVVYVPVRFVVKPHPIMIEESHEARLQCEATGYPEPTITWTAAARELPMPEDEPIKGQLVLANASINESGTYTCTAENVVNKVMASAQLSVLSRLDFLIRPAMKLQTHVGKKVSLHCEAKGGDITWSKQCGRLPETHQILSNGTLLLNISSLDNGGVYICTATNALSALNASSEIKVHVRSCSEWHLAGYKQSGVFRVKPNQGAPDFEVFCNMSDKNGVGVSVVSHNAEERTVVEGFMDPGSYFKDVTYLGVTMAQIEHLIDASAHCEQFIKYECRHSVLKWEGLHYGWWVSRHGEKMTYWGGAESGSGMCACGINNTCATGTACNCDANDVSWREDSGLLTDKKSLPVLQLRFGDTGDPRVEKGYHTLGKLKCYGIA